MRKKWWIFLVAPPAHGAFRLDLRRDGNAFVELAAADAVRMASRLRSGKVSDSWFSAGFCSEAGAEAAVTAQDSGGEGPENGNE